MNDGSGLLWLLISLLLHASKMNVIVQALLDNREQFIELIVAGQTFYRLSLPVVKSTRDKLIVFFPRERLHEEEIA